MCIDTCWAFRHVGYRRHVLPESLLAIAAVNRACNMMCVSRVQPILSWQYLPLPGDTLGRGSQALPGQANCVPLSLPPLDAAVLEVTIVR